jgi:superfamily II DNA or RNA helicase
VLRKGSEGHKLALLYEVVAEDTSEEGTSQRRHGAEGRKEPQTHKATEKPKPKLRQLELDISASSSIYEVNRSTRYKAAESTKPWKEEDAPEAES